MLIIRIIFDKSISFLKFTVELRKLLFPFFEILLVLSLVKCNYPAKNLDARIN